jgi:hypothetical protein
MPAFIRRCGSVWLWAACAAAQAPDAEPVATTVEGLRVQVRAANLLPYRTAVGEGWMVALSFAVELPATADDTEWAALAPKLDADGVLEGALGQVELAGFRARAGSGPALMPVDVMEISRQRMNARGAARGQLVEETPRRVAHQQTRIILRKDGDAPPKEIARLQGEALRGRIRREEFAFAGADLAAGAEIVQRGNRARLYCYDRDGDVLAIGVRLAGPAAGAVGMTFQENALSTRPPRRLRVDFADGTNATIGIGSMGRSGVGMQAQTRMTAELPVQGKTVRGVTLLIEEPEPEAESVAFTLTNVPLPAPAMGNRLPGQPGIPPAVVAPAAPVLVAPPFLAPAPQAVPPPS